MKSDVFDEAIKAVLQETRDHWINRSLPHVRADSLTILPKDDVQQALREKFMNRDAKSAGQLTQIEHRNISFAPFD
jgi:hypothetical protein